MTSHRTAYAPMSLLGRLPKPSPPDGLLGPGQRWTIVEAEGWSAVEEFRPCNSCDETAVAWMLNRSQQRQFVCDTHLGSHRWLGLDGVVRQWRANPPWVDDDYIEARRAYLNWVGLDRRRAASSLSLRLSPLVEGGVDSVE